MKSRSISEKKPVSVIKLGHRRQLVIPRAVCQRLGLHGGDFVEVAVRNGAAVLKPRDVDGDDKLTPEEEKLVHRGEKQLRQGEYILWDDLKKKLKL